MRRNARTAVLGGLPPRTPSHAWTVQVDDTTTIKMPELSATTAKQEHSPRKLLQALVMAPAYRAPSRPPVHQAARPVSNVQLVVWTTIAMEQLYVSYAQQERPRQMASASHAAMGWSPLPERHHVWPASPATHKQSALRSGRRALLQLDASTL